MLSKRKLISLAEPDQRNIWDLLGKNLPMDPELTKLTQEEAFLRAELFKQIKVNVVFVETAESKALNAKIKAAILKTPFRNDWLKSTLHYVNQEVADLLAVHPDPRIKAFGIQCADYFKTPECVVNKMTGMVEGTLADPKQKQLCWGLDISARGWRLKAFATYNANNAVHTPLFNDSNEIPDRKLLSTFRKDTPCMKFSERDWDLIPPDCVAAMLGDIDVLEMLQNKGKELGYCPAKEYRNTLEFAVMFGQANVVKFCIVNQVTCYSATVKKLFNLAIQNGDMTILELLANHYEVPDCTMALAKTINPMLAAYLEIKRILFFCRKSHGNPLWQLIGECTHTSDEFLIKFICTFPRLVNAQRERDGHHFLHNLLSCTSSKKLDHIKQYLSAIRAAKCIKDIPFDIELKTKDGKTPLKLAFETGVNDIVVALLIYGDPSIKDFESEINQANIVMSEIILERNALSRKITEKNSQMLLSQMEMLQRTNMNVGALTMAQEGLHQVLNQVVNVVASTPQISSARGSNQRLMMFPPVRAITNNDDDDNPADLTSVLAELTQLKREMTAMQQRVSVLEEKLSKDFIIRPR